MLVHEVWACVVVEADFQPLGAAEITELDRRIAEDDAALSDVTEWKVIKAEAQSCWQP